MSRLMTKGVTVAVLSAVLLPSCSRYAPDRSGPVRKAEPYGSYQYVIVLPNVREYVWELSDADPRSPGKPDGHARYAIKSPEGRSLVEQWLADNRDGMQEVLTAALGQMLVPVLYALTEDGCVYEYPLAGVVVVGMGRPAFKGNQKLKEVTSTKELKRLESIFTEHGEPMDHFPQRRQARVPPHVEPPPRGAEEPKR